MKVWRDFLFKLFGLGMVVVLAVMIASILPSKTCHAADGMRFKSISKMHYISFGGQKDMMDFYQYDGEKVTFMITGQRRLTMYYKGGSMSFDYYEGRNEGSYGVHEIITENPRMILYQITATSGAHAMNNGYWLVGKHKGKWVKFISLDNLAKMGHTPLEWHQIESRITNTGNMRIISSHEYLPPGVIYQVYRKHAVDMVVELFWDKNAQWFGMKRVL